MKECEKLRDDLAQGARFAAMANAKKGELTEQVWMAGAGLPPDTGNVDGSSPEMHTRDDHITITSDSDATASAGASDHSYCGHWRLSNRRSLYTGIAKAVSHQAARR